MPKIFNKLPIFNDLRPMSTETKKIFFRLNFSIIFGIFCLFCTGCATQSFLKLPLADQLRTNLTRKVQIDILLTHETNFQTAVAVDFLTVHDKELAKLLAETSAKQWFAMKNQIKNDFKSGSAIDLEECEYTAGSVTPAVKLPWRNRNTVLFIFADYRVPGLHRYRSTKREEIQITFNEKNFTEKRNWKSVIRYYILKTSGGCATLHRWLFTISPLAQLRK
jgi:type VI secretion system protein